MKIRFLSFKTIRGKIAQFLLQQVESGQDTLILKRSQQALADLFGVTRPSLARALSALQKEGIIRIQRKEITILDRNMLNQLIIENR